MWRPQLLLALSLVAFVEGLTDIVAPVQAQTSWATPVADRQTAVKPRSLMLIPVPRQPGWLVEAFQQDDPAFTALLAKKVAYSVLCNELMGIANPWAVYASWVDLHSGPTGHEQYIGGLASVNNAQELQSAAAAARAFVVQEPRIPQLDDAVDALAAMIESAPAIINEADAYYRRQDYKDDDFKLAVEYHARLISVIPPLLAARDVVIQQIGTLSDRLDLVELERIEQVDRKRYTWYSRRVLLQAGKLASFFDFELDDRRREELKAAIAEFGIAVRDFDNYRAQPAAQRGYTGSDASRLLVGTREWREGLRNIWSVVDDYNSLIKDLQPGPDGAP